MFSLALQLSAEKNNRQLVNNIKGSSVKRNTAASTYQYERGYAPVGSMAVGQTYTSRSEPGGARQLSMPKNPVPLQRLISNRGTYRTERATSQFITNTTSQPQLQLLHTMNGTGQTKSNSQFVCSKVDVTKTLSKPPVTEGAPNTKGDSGWVRLTCHIFLSSNDDDESNVSMYKWFLHAF